MLILIFNIITLIACIVSVIYHNKAMKRINAYLENEKDDCRTKFNYFKKDNILYCYHDWKRDENSCSNFTCLKCGEKKHNCGGICPECFPINIGDKK